MVIKHLRLVTTLYNSQTFRRISNIWSQVKRCAAAFVEVFGSYLTTLEDAELNQTKFNFWNSSNTPRPIEDGDDYAFPCPQCGMEYGGVHVAAVRIAPHGDRNRPAAQIALACEQGCLTTVFSERDDCISSAVLLIGAEPPEIVSRWEILLWPSSERFRAVTG